jgi:hypothetical protein
MDAASNSHLVKLRNVFLSYDTILLDETVERINEAGWPYMHLGDPTGLL